MRGVFSHSGRPAHLDYDPVQQTRAMAHHAKCEEAAGIERECATLRLDILRYMAATGKTQVAISALANVTYGVLSRLLAGNVITPESRAKLRAIIP